LQIQNETETVAETEPKEMLSVRTAPDGRLDVRINFSSLDIIQTCKRKAYFSLRRKLRSTEEAPPLTFGSAIHKALEVFYCAPRADRSKPSTGICDDAQSLMLMGAQPLAHGACVRCASVFTFLERGSSLKHLPDGDKRSLSNGLATLNAYFDRYSDDPFVIAKDGDGPLCERRFDFLLCEDAKRRITFFGTIDAIFLNEETKQYVVCDHKTTSALGADFYNRVRPNHQYTGYVLAAQRALGLANVDTFISNGIQVAKTKKEFARQATKITAEDFAELQYAVEQAVDDYLWADHRGIWPMSTPNACCMYGRCSYARICEVPNALKPSVIAALYGEEHA